MKILFIGNSYTYYNDMPSLFETLARENKRDVTVDSVTVGGRRLVENLDARDVHGAKIRKLLENNEYDILFLQEQSYLALVDYEKFERGVVGLSELVGARRTLLYATWGRKSGSELLGEYGWTSSQMGADLHAAYTKAAKSCFGEVSAVGRAFADVNENAAQINLYDPDLSHPSYLGTCLGVLVHYKTVFGEMPDKTESLGLRDEDEKILLAAARRI